MGTQLRWRCRLTSWPAVIAGWSFLISPALAATRYVDQNAVGLNNGASWANAYTELQSALVVALSGDQIWVAAGTYLPDYNVNAGLHTQDRSTSFPLKTGVAIYGGFPTGGGDGTIAARHPDIYAATLSGDLNGDDDSGGDYSENSNNVVTGDSAASSAVLDGFAVTAGNAPDGSGGGLLISGGSPTVQTCRFTRNHALYGGGIYVGNAAPLIADCDFAENITEHSGGGIEMYGCGPGLRIIDCTFVANSTQWGGGILVFTSSPTITGCVFAQNVTFYEGGGIYNFINSNPVITRCTFTQNQTGGAGGMSNVQSCSPTVTECIFEGNLSDTGGGGMYNWVQSNPTVTRCVFRGNSSGSFGGGMFNETNSNPTVVNCLFTGNSALVNGGGLRNRENSSPFVVNCTFTGNHAGVLGGGMHTESGNPVLANCILWDNSDPSGTGQSAQIGGVTPLIGYSCIKGWNGSPGGSGNIGINPLFVDADGPDNVFGTSDDDPHVSPNSPTIDAGDNSAIQATGVTVDLAGNVRIVDQGGVPNTGSPGTGAIVDMGVFEVAGDCNNNGHPDETDLDSDGDGVIDDCEVCPGDLDHDHDVDMTDFGRLQICYGPWPSPGCFEADLNHDFAVGPADAALLIKCMSGANVTCNPNCAQ